MKINYEEFNQLQEQQLIRDTAQRAWSELYQLYNLFPRKHHKALDEMMNYVFSIQSAAIEEIRKMVDGGDDETE